MDRCSYLKIAMSVPCQLCSTSDFKLAHGSAAIMTRGAAPEWSTMRFKKNCGTWDLEKKRTWKIGIQCKTFKANNQNFKNRKKSADPASPWPRQGGAWEHRRCGTLLSLKATVNCTTASDLLWDSKTDGCVAPPSCPDLKGFPTAETSLD